jgi:hypothetical protein
MASGLPCVISDACGCSEDLAKPEGLGISFPWGQPKALAAVLGAIETRSVTTENIASFNADNTIGATVATVHRCYRYLKGPAIAV